MILCQMPLYYFGKKVPWCLTPSQPLQLYQDQGFGKKVPRCLTPSQPLQLYQDEGFGKKVTWCLTASQPLVILGRGLQQESNLVFNGQSTISYTRARASARK